MEIVLLILKIIGIVLLSLVGLILLLALLLLFWPFSYRIKGYKQEKEYDVAVRIHWLLGLLNATVNYNGEAWLKVRVLGIPVYKLKIYPEEETAGEETETSGDESEATETSGDESEASDTGTEESEAVNANADGSALSGNEHEAETGNNETDAIKDDVLEEEDNEASDEEWAREIEEQWNHDTEEDTFGQLPFYKKIASFINKIKEFILNFKEKCYNTIDSIKQKVKDIKRTYREIKHYIKLLQHPCIQPALKKLWKCCKKFLKHIKPRHVRANIEYGTNDPASTMKVYGYYCMIYPFYGKQIRFHPDMEHEVLNIHAKISGRIMVFRMMLLGVSIIADRNIIKLIRLIRREVKRRGRK